MKKALLAILQIAVTVAVLIWVFHDPQKRHKMGEALHAARVWMDHGSNPRLLPG